MEKNEAIRARAFLERAWCDAEYLAFRAWTDARHAAITSSRARAAKAGADYLRAQAVANAAYCAFQAAELA